MQYNSRLFFALITLLFLTSCQTEVKKELTIEDHRMEVEQYQKELFSAEYTALDVFKADSMILLYKSYAEEYPEDSMSIQYLFKAAEVQMGIDKDLDCIATLSQIQNTYPDSKIIPMLLQFKAYVYDEKLHEYEKAIMIMDELIENYPDDKLIPNAKAYRDMIGKDPQELFQRADSTQSIGS